MNGKTTIVGAAFIFIIALALRLPYFGWDVLNLDETIYATIAREILHGAIPYRDVWEIKPPLIFYLYALMFKVFGDKNLFPIHILAAVSMGLTSLVCADIARREWGKLAGLLAGLGVAIYTTCAHTFDVQAAETELFLLLPLMLGVRAFLRADEKNPYLNMFLAGFLVSVAALFKQPAGGVGILMAAWALKYPPGGSTRLKSLVLLALGALPLPVLLLAYFASKGALSDTLNLVFFNNFRYMAERGKSSALWTLLSSSYALAAPNFILWIAGFGSALGIFYNVWHGQTSFARGMDAAKQRHLLFLALFLLMSSFGAFVGIYLNGHYYLLMIPALVILWAWLITFLWERYRNSVFKELKPALAITALTGVLYPAIYFHIYVGPIVEKNEIEPNNKFHLSIGEGTKGLAGPGDRIFVWGLDPQVYYYSNRRPAGRFLYTTFQMGFVFNTPTNTRSDAPSQYAMPESWELLIQDLEKYNPEVFLDSTEFFEKTRYHSTSRYPLLRKWLEQNYELYYEYEKYKIYVRRH